MFETLHRCADLALLAHDLTRMAVQSRDARIASSTAALEKRRSAVVRRLGLLHGLPQKVGQLLSFSDLDAALPYPGQSSGAEPDSNASAFLDLADRSAPMSQGEFLGCVENELGAPWSQHFAWIDSKPWAASMGQVQKARLHNGRWVAIKVQYPGIGRSLETDLAALGWLTKPWSGLRHGVGIQAFREAIGRSIRRELDYLAEAGMTTRFAECVQGLTGICVPAVYPEMSTVRLLTMEWIDGVSVQSCRAWPQTHRDALGTSLVLLFLKGIFQWRLLHTDPNPGNYRFMGPSASLLSDAGVAVGVLDFGSVHEVPSSFGRCWRRMIEETQSADGREWRVEEALIEMGFGAPLIRKLRGRLLSFARLMSEPFHFRGPWGAGDWNLGPRLAELLGPERLEFRSAGPPDLIFILRSLQGLLRYLRVLDARVNWSSLYDSLGHGESMSVAQPRGIGADPLGVEGKGIKSEALNIQVRRGGQIKVSLSFAASATEHLDELIPLEMHRILSERQVDVRALIAQARRHDFAPGDLFHLQDGEKEVRVWLA